MKETLSKLLWDLERAAYNHNQKDIDEAKARIEKEVFSMEFLLGGMEDRMYPCDRISLAPELEHTVVSEKLQVGLPKKVQVSVEEKITGSAHPGKK